jgi:hypothetical protein
MAPYVPSMARICAGAAFDRGSRRTGPSPGAATQLDLPDRALSLRATDVV